MTKIFSEFSAAVTFLLVLFFGWQPKKRTGNGHAKEMNRNENRKKRDHPF
jgi:hypothetical protein